MYRFLTAVSITAGGYFFDVKLTCQFVANSGSATGGKIIRRPLIQKIVAAQQIEQYVAFPRAKVI